MQLDVLLVESSLRLQARVTSGRSGAPSPQAGPLMAGGAETGAAEILTTWARGEAVDTRHVPPGRALSAGSGGMAGSDAPIRPRALPIATRAEVSAKPRTIAQVVSGSPWRARAGVMLLLAALTIGAVQWAHHAFVMTIAVTTSASAPSSAADTVDSAERPETAGSSLVPKSGSESPAGAPSVMRVVPAHNPVPQPSAVPTAPLLALAPDLARAPVDGLSMAQASPISPVDPPTGGQEAMRSGAGSTLSAVERTEASASAGPDDGTEEEERPLADTDTSKVARALEAPSPLTIAVPPPRPKPGPPVKEPADVSGAAPSSAGSRPPAGTLPERGPKPSAVASKTAGPKTSPARFAPALITLKDATSVLQVFIALQKRHPVLSSKIPEVRPVAGEGQTTWYQLLVGPAVTQTEAKEVCRQLGPEGQTLGCTVAAY